MRKSRKIVSILALLVFFINALMINTEIAQASSPPQVSYDPGSGNLTFSTVTQQATSATVFRTLGWTISADINGVGRLRTTVSMQQNGADIPLGNGMIRTNFIVPMTDAYNSVLERLKQDNPSYTNEIINFFNTGGTIYLDAIQTVLNSINGNSTGALDSYGKRAYGYISTSYGEISNAEPWASQTVSDLQQYFGINIWFPAIPQVKTKTVNVQYIQLFADGSKAVIPSSNYTTSNRIIAKKELMTGEKWSSDYTREEFDDKKYLYCISNTDGSMNGTKDYSIIKNAYFSYDSAPELYIAFYYEAKPIPPSPTSKGSITVQYKDSDGNHIVTPTVRTNLELGTYTENAKEFDAYSLNDSPSKTVTLTEDNRDQTITFNYLKKIGPTATIAAPHNVFMGDEVDVTGTGNTKDKTVTSLQGRIDFQEKTDVNGTVPIIGDKTVSKDEKGNSLPVSSTSFGGDVWFSREGDFHAQSTVKDNYNNSGKSNIATIHVVHPVPSVSIRKDGTEKENRKVVIDASNSNGGCNTREGNNRWPIDWQKAQWRITPLNGASMNDLRIQTHVEGIADGTVIYDPSRNITDLTKLNGLKIFDITCKNSGPYKSAQYKFELTLTSNCTFNPNLHYTNTNNITVTIVEDLPPVVNFNLSSIIFRDPGTTGSDGKTEAIQTILDDESLTNGSYSIDGDVIVKRVWEFAFDSNNDGNYLDEKWYGYSNGTWQYIGNYSQAKNIDIDKINDENIKKVLITSSHVGKYDVEVIVREEFGQEYIPQFVSISDRKVGTSFK